MNSVLPVFKTLFQHIHALGSDVRLFGPFFFFLSFFLVSGTLSGQTDFAPGQIMFTGYDSDDPDAFSIVILADVTSGTTIYITDRGWSSATGFRDDNNGEGTISFQFNADYPCGTTIVFTDVGGTNDWAATDVYGISIGTVTILTSTTESPSQDPDGIELGIEGDQLFIYQSPEPNPGNQTGFVTGIHMNGGAWNAGNGDDFSSQKPSGLADNQVVRFNTEVDNAKYDCTPSTGTASALQAAIENDNGAGGLISDFTNNWQESNNRIDLYPTCSFCCGSTPPAAAPQLSAPSLVSPNEVFTINITGTLAPGENWELYTAGCGVGTPLQTTTSSSFSVTAPSTEGIVAYYVRTSEEVDCGALCAVIEVGVCTNQNNMNTCTDCNADPQACGDCLLPPTADNPDLDSGCYAIKLIFILDESGSIIGNEPEVKAGVLAFLNAINGQDMEVALIEFSDLGRVVNNYTPVNNAYILNIETYFDGPPGTYNGHNYNPGGGTNWHDAMIKADAMEPADILLFFTDGIPTGWTNNGFVDYCGNGSTTQTPEIVNPVKLANKLKGEDTHIFMLGVGGGIDEENLQLMSGPIEYNAGINTIGSADWSIGNFVDLAEDLEAFVDELCETPLELDKQVLGAICDGVQQFMFIIHNPGEESAATVVQVIDTFPSGYTNIVYNGPPFIKLCIGAACAAQGQPQPDNAFIWTTNSLPPGESDTLILSVDVLPTGSYMNKAWAEGSNTGLVSDTATGNNTNDDLPPTVSCPGDITIECSDSSLPSATGSATGMDPDGSVPDITYADSIVNGSCTGEFTINRTWKATDGCTNTATCIQVIVAEDNTPPDVDCPADITIQCGDNTLPANTGDLSAVDNCDMLPGVTYSDITMEASCGSTIERTWVAEDDCGNSSSCTQMITITDSVIPSITCPPNVTILCTDSTLPGDTGGPATATDNCDPDPDVSFTEVINPGGCTQEYSITRTWKAIDACGNSSTCNQTITVDDNTPPALSCPSNVTIDCSESTLPANTGSATATDNCNPTPDVTSSNAITNGPCPQAYTITRTWTASDGCGNNTTCIQVITVDDSLPPELSCPANITIECADSTLPSNTGNATAVDNCDPASSVSFDDVTVDGSCPQEYTITRTWTAMDDCGNSSTCIQIIFIDDSTPPTVSCPANITIECTANTLPGNTGTATSSDNCDSAPEVAFNDVSVAGGCSQEYTIFRTWSATDECGNTGTCVQTIVIDDSTAPSISCPADITIECTEVTLPANTGSATGTDNCDAAPAITFTDVTVSGACPQEYTITRTWQATDECGNSSTCNQIIFIDDSVAPLISCPTDVTIECTSSTLPSNTGSATGTDNCDASPSVTFSDTSISGACPQEYTITRTWVVTDDCDNSTTCIQMITIDDSMAPAITCPANITIECTDSTLPENIGTATGTDNCDTAPAITFTDVTLSGACPQEYTITRTWRATDECGNSSTCNQIIFIDDSTSPVLSCPANVTIECTDNTLPANTGSATATDNCDLAPVVSYSDVTVSGACPQEYTITRTWLATDACGNSSTCDQVITIEDTSPPEITCPADITIECIENTLPDSTGIPELLDSCDPSPEVIFNDVTLEGPTPNGYTIQRTWTTSDSCGNTSTCLQIITVENPIVPDTSGLTFDTICSGQSLEFIAEEQQYENAVYDWVFGSGSNPSSASGIGPHSVTYTYNATNGSIGASVLLTVSIDGCASVTDTVANVHVNAIPDPTINASASNLCYFRLRTFKPLAAQMPGFTYQWNFGPGASIPPVSGYGPHQVEYSTTGSKTVQLIVFSNEEGASCGDTGTLTFNVVACPGNITGKVLRPDGTGIGAVNIRLYNDNDLNGLPDGASIRSVFTTSAGLYSIINLVPGQYVIGQTDLPGYFSLYDIDETDDFDTVVYSDPNDNFIPATMEPQEIDADNIFVDATSPGIINGYVFEDFDNDGLPDPGEGIGGVTIQLTPDADQNGEADGGGPLAITTTSDIGFYTFGDIPLGDYVLTEIQPGGYDNVADIDFTNDGDIVPNTNTMNDTLPVTLINGETDSHNFFKETSTCSRIVTNINDSGAGSFRFAVNCASAGDTIEFHSSLANQVIHLTSDRIIIDKNIYIHSALSPRVRIHSDISGAFKINTGFIAEFKNINFTSGLSGHLGAAFENYGQLILWDASVVKNQLLMPGNYLLFNGSTGMTISKGIILIELD